MATLCEICQELFGGKESDPKCPRMLLCGHTFCTACLQSWSQKTPDDFISCPICMQKGSNSKDISQIPVNRAITTLLSIKFLTKSTLYTDADLGKKKDLKPDFIFKIISLGNSGAGKTQTSIRFAMDKFEAEIQNTIGLENFSRLVRVNDKIVQVYIWDTAGSEQFNGVISGYVRGAHGVFFVFDLHNRKSFEQLGRWVQFYETFNGFDDSFGILLGNKNDIKDNIVVKRAEAEEFAGKNKLRYFEGSAKSGENIREAFVYLIEKLIERKMREKETEKETEKKKEEGFVIIGGNSATPMHGKMGETIVLGENNIYKKKCC